MLPTGIPQPTEWQRIGDQINAASIFARADFVNVLRISHPLWDRRNFPARGCGLISIRVIPMASRCYIVID